MKRSGGQRAEPPLKRKYWKALVSLNAEQDSDLDVVINPATEIISTNPVRGFGLIWSSARATVGVTKGQHWFECKILRELPVTSEIQSKGDHAARIGWSTQGSSLSLGNSAESFCYCSTGKAYNKSRFLNFGVPVEVGDTFAAFIDCDGREIRFAVNGRDVGCSYRFPSHLHGRPFYPHVSIKNMECQLNFGTKTPSFKSPHPRFELIEFASKWMLDFPPPTRYPPELLVLVGLPFSGKTKLAYEYQRTTPDRHFEVLSVNSIIDKMKIPGSYYDRGFTSRMNLLVSEAVECYNALLQIAPSRERNYIIDQPNITVEERTALLNLFQGWEKKALILMPSNAELRRREEEAQFTEGKYIRQETMLNLKENFTLPTYQEGFTEIIFLNQQYGFMEYEQVEEQLDKYKKDASANIKPKPEPSPTVSAANDLQFMIPEYRNRLEINDTEDTCVEFLEYPRLGPEDFRYAMDKTYSPSSSLGITRSPSTVVPPSPTVVLPSPFSLLGEDHHIQRQTETESQERDHEEEHSTHEGLFELIGSFDDSISAKSVSTDDEGYLQGGADLILANGEFEVDGKIYTRSRLRPRRSLGDVTESPVKKNRNSGKGLERQRSRELKKQAEKTLLYGLAKDPQICEIFQMDSDEDRDARSSDLSSSDSEVTFQMFDSNGNSMVLDEEAPTDEILPDDDIVVSTTKTLLIDLSGPDLDVPQNGPRKSRAKKKREKQKKKKKTPNSKKFKVSGGTKSRSEEVDDDEEDVEEDTTWSWREKKSPTTRSQTKAWAKPRGRTKAKHSGAIEEVDTTETKAKTKSKLPRGTTTQEAHWEMDVDTDECHMTQQPAAPLEPVLSKKQHSSEGKQQQSSVALLKESLTLKRKKNLSEQDPLTLPGVTTRSESKKRSRESFSSSETGSARETRSRSRGGATEQRREAAYGVTSHEEGFSLSADEGHEMMLGESGIFGPPSVKRKRKVVETEKSFSIPPKQTNSPTLGLSASSPAASSRIASPSPGGSSGLDISMELQNSSSLSRSQPAAYGTGTFGTGSDGLPQSHGPWNFGASSPILSLQAEKKEIPREKEIVNVPVPVPATPKEKAPERHIFRSPSERSDSGSGGVFGGTTFSRNTAAPKTRDRSRAVLKKATKLDPEEATNLQDNRVDQAQTEPVHIQIAPSTKTVLDLSGSEESMSIQHETPVRYSPVSHAPTVVIHQRETVLPPTVPIPIPPHVVPASPAKIEIETPLVQTQTQKVQKMEIPSSPSLRRSYQDGLHHQQKLVNTSLEKSLKILQQAQQQHVTKNNEPGRREGITKSVTNSEPGSGVNSPKSTRVSPTSTSHQQGLLNLNTQGPAENVGGSGKDGGEALKHVSTKMGLVPPSPSKLLSVTPQQVAAVVAAMETDEDQTVLDTDCGESTSETTLNIPQTPSVSDGDGATEVLSPSSSGLSSSSLSQERDDISWSSLELLEVVGSGAFGQVWKALWADQTVAVKRLHTIDPEPVAMFIKEMSLMCKLEHPNVIQYLGCSSKNPFIFMVMQFLPTTLSKLIRGCSGNMPSDIYLTIANGISSGMAYLHEKNIIHRDLKPSNILMAPDHVAKIADFGISRASECTSTKTSIGTPTYMAPELFMTMKYGFKIDVYSFGMIMWQMLSGKKPLAGAGPGGIDLIPIQYAFKIAAGVRPDIDPACPAILSSLISDCWNQEPSVRPSFSGILAILPTIPGWVLGGDAAGPKEQTT